MRVNKDMMMRMMTTAFASGKMFNSFPAGKKQAKFTKLNVYFISRQLFTAKRPTISHFKVYKMGFSEKINLIIVTQHFSEK